MLKTQKCVHEMMKVLGLPLPNEERPGLIDLKFDLLRNLVTEEFDEFDHAMDALQILSDRKSDYRNFLLEMLPPDMDQERVDSFKQMTPGEFDQAMGFYWWAEVIDAICDCIVVLHNTSNAMGVDIEPFFDEVHRTNMQKAEGPLREDGKRLKPPGWKPPEIEKMLRNLIMTGEAKK